MARKRINYRVRSNGLLEHRFKYEGEWYSVYGFTVDECEQKKEKKKERLKAKLYTKNINITLNAYYDEWQGQRNGVVTKSTQYANDVKFKRIRESRLGKRKIIDIESREIKSFQQELARKVSTSTVNDTITLLKCILESAVEDRIISHNPCSSVKSLKRVEAPATETIHRALTEEETQLFFQYAKQTWYYLFFAFMVSTGCRVGEVSALTWRDIDYQAGMIHINKTVTRISNTEYVVGEPKTRSSKRDIPLTDSIKSILTQQKEVSRILNLDGRIFTSVSGGYVKKNSVNTCIKYILKQIEDETGEHIEPFSTHAFRDTFATRAIEQGMQPQTLKTILGHSSLSMTMDLYAHVMPNTKQEEMSKIYIAV